jgi:hypothetical protein
MFDRIFKKIRSTCPEAHSDLPLLLFLSLGRNLRPMADQIS